MRGTAPQFREIGTFPPKKRRCHSERGLRRTADKESRSCLAGLWHFSSSLVAAVLGFGGIAGLSTKCLKIIFFVAVVLVPDLGNRRDRARLSTVP
jgi:uncharacterized membrane protein YtjA (UPF0391 family)